MLDHRTASIGRVRVTDWNNPMWSLKKDPFVSFSEVQSSRYALSYNPDIRGSIYIDCAFIVLDSETLESEVYHTDFGDIMFPTYKGTLKDSQITPEYEDMGDSDEIEHEDSHYLTPSINTYLTNKLHV